MKHAEIIGRASAVCGGKNMAVLESLRSGAKQRNTEKERRQREKSRIKIKRIAEQMGKHEEESSKAGSLKTMNQSFVPEREKFSQPNLETTHKDTGNQQQAMKGHNATDNDSQPNCQWPGHTQ